MEIFSIDIGETVLCDLCNDEYSESDEQGGVLLGSSVACPTCVKKFNITEHDGECPKGLSFKEWVLKLRNGNNKISVSFY